jgi:Tfp pilus assembly protein PilE
MKNLKILLNQSAGMGLVQVMLVAAMLGGLALVASQIMTNQQKVTNKMFSDVDLNQFQMTILGFLNKKESCTNALSGLDKGTSFQNLKFEGNQDFISVEEKLGSTGFTVSNMKILNDTEAAAASLKVAKNLVHLRIGLSQGKNIVGGKDRFVYFSTVADVGQTAVITRETINQVQSRCDELVGTIEGTIQFDPTNGIYTGMCKHSDGNMINSCGI